MNQRKMSAMEMLLLIMFSVAASGAKNAAGSVTALDHRAGDAHENISENDLENLKEKIADVVGEVFYNFSRDQAQTFEHVEDGSGAEAEEENSDTKDAELKESYLAVTEDDIKEEARDDLEDKPRGQDVVYLGVCGGVGGVVVVILLVVLMMVVVKRVKKKRGTWRLERV